jgi:hypothetical protein
MYIVGFISRCMNALLKIHRRTQVHPCISPCAHFRSVSIVLVALLLLFDINVHAQSKDSLPTGFLPDAAEEYWPAYHVGDKKDFSHRVSHMPIRRGKGFIGIGGYFREVYELYDNYLWGSGVQDNNGYLLHRAIVHSDIRYNKNIRVFVQLQSSFLSGRNGGPRPVVDLNKLAVDQIFGEYSFFTKNKSLYRVRIGKQALNYGVGSLLDIRETNVRRGFFGGKFIAEYRDTKVDLFAMKLMKAYQGFFDDKIDYTQKIAGAWVTQTFPHKALNRFDAYYLYTHRGSVNVLQGLGTESRHTIGTALSFSKHRWTGYAEMDVQLGKFNDHSILAWKLTQAITYQLTNVLLKPAWSVQSAMSSGDHNLQDSALGTFNPIYPKAIYYGFLDNTGSANMFLVHTKVEIEPVRRIKLTTGYYIFWRQSIVDGLYGPNGFLLLTPDNNQRRVGSMIDLMALYTFNAHVSLRGIVAYYKRGPFLKQHADTPHDIRYLGVMATLRL